jgi:hypothetical protein
MYTFSFPCVKRTNRPTPRIDKALMLISRKLFNFSTVVLLMDLQKIRVRKPVWSNNWDVGKASKSQHLSVDKIYWIYLLYRKINRSHFWCLFSTTKIHGDMRVLGYIQDNWLWYQCAKNFIQNHPKSCCWQCFWHPW